MSSDKELRLNEDPRPAEGKLVWFGTIHGVQYEINKWKGDANYFQEAWTHYIRINIDKQLPDEFKEKFWLEGKMESFREGGPGHVQYDYYNSIISQLEFHGGCTYYQKVSGFDGEDRAVKIGCDYMHSWDEDKHYNFSYVQSSVEETVRSLLVLLGGRLNVWSHRDGFYYPMPQEYYEKVCRGT